MRRPSFRRWLGYVVVATACCWPARLESQGTAANLKAAFLVNFTKFTEWPPGALIGGSPLVLCVAGDDEVADALAQIVATYKATDRALAVRRLAADASETVCHVLYTGGGKEMPKLIDRFKGAPVLTVSDRKEFSKQDGMVEFFVADDRMRFAINVDTARLHGLQLSSRLLSLAKVVRHTDR